MLRYTLVNPMRMTRSVVNVAGIVGVTEPTGGEVAPTDVNQFSDVRTPTEVADKAVAKSTVLRRSTRMRKPFVKMNMLFMDW